MTFLADFLHIFSTLAMAAVGLGVLALMVWIAVAVAMEVARIQEHRR